MGKILINVSDATVNLAGKVILEGVDWEIQQGQHIGLVGPNGAGKSTLFKLISDELAAESGNVFRTSGLTIGRLEQEPQMLDSRTVMAEAMSAVPELARIEAQLEKLAQQMEEPEVYENPVALQRAITTQEKLLLQFEQLDGQRYESLVKETLVALGFDQDTWQQSTDQLSGGQKKLVMLAKLVVGQPQLLLLDEPDNHLDLQAKANLERLINNYDGSVVIISHDRYLLDGVASSIADLENGRLTVYHGNYSAYSTEKEIRRLRQQQLYEAQQKEIAQIEAAIARFELWASLVVNERHIRQARSRRRMLDKMDKVEKVTQSRKMNLELGGWRGSKKVVELVDVGKKFENGRVLFSGLNQTLWHGERVGLVGPNGSGKSMLLKMILDPDLVTIGEIKVGPSIRIGYYAQEQETLDPTKDLIATVREIAPLSRESAVAFLMRFLFKYDQMQQPVGKLSGGERSRLQLARLVLLRPNLLALDEPTNNLDIQAIEVLEETLDEFVGTVLVISHDRYFLDKVVDRTIELRDGELYGFLGGYTDYLEAKGTLEAR